LAAVDEAAAGADLSSATAAIVSSESAAIIAILIKSVPLVIGWPRDRGCVWKTG
jgi:hypothetical protein